jgi:hypothetical protein
MYAPTYGFGQGVGGAAMNPNAPPNAPQPGQQQHMAQQPQNMMYYPQQHGPGGLQNPYAGMGVNPGMMQNNNGMAHMPANNGLGM